jgi:hypothetical protein
MNTLKSHIETFQSSLNQLISSPNNNTTLSTSNSLQQQNAPFIRLLDTVFVNFAQMIVDAIKEISEIQDDSPEASFLFNLEADVRYFLNLWNSLDEFVQEKILEFSSSRTNNNNDDQSIEQSTSNLVVDIEKEEKEREFSLTSNWRRIQEQFELEMRKQVNHKSLIVFILSKAIQERQQQQKSAKILETFFSVAIRRGYTREASFCISREIQKMNSLNFSLLKTLFSVSKITTKARTDLVCNILSSISSSDVAMENPSGITKYFAEMIESFIAQNKRILSMKIGGLKQSSLFL